MGAEWTGGIDVVIPCHNAKPFIGEAIESVLAQGSFLRVGPFDASLRAGEMIDWLSRAEAASLLIHQTEHASLRRRIHWGNTMRNSAFSHANYLQALKASIDRGRTASRLAGAR